LNYLELKQLYGIEEISEYIERTTCGSMATPDGRICGKPGKWVLMVDRRFYAMCQPHTVSVMSNPEFKTRVRMNPAPNFTI
jgi:hypothetical protein